MMALRPTAIKKITVSKVVANSIQLHLAIGKLIRVRFQLTDNINTLRHLHFFLRDKRGKFRLIRVFNITLHHTQKSPMFLFFCFSLNRKNFPNTHIYSITI